jgi:hypothetical protein
MLRADYGNSPRQGPGDHLRLLGVAHRGRQG